MAVDPLAQAFYSPSGVQSQTVDIGVLQVHVPLLLGFNFDEYTTLVLSPGFVGTVATRTAAGNFPTSEAAWATSGAGVRLGVGMNFRASDKLSWQPEVTAWQEFNEADTWALVVGIGINLGAQPDYSDLGDGSRR